MLRATSFISALVLALTSYSITSLPARAGGEGVAAGIIGFAAGAIVGSQMNKNRRPVYRSHRSSGRSAEERAYWKSIQAALNQVGFDAGPVDGAPGRRTRAAIKGFQLTIPAEPTGTLTPQQTQLLFARVNPQPVYANQPVNVAPPLGYQNQPVQTFPNITLPGNGTAGTVQPAGQQLSFPTPETAKDAPAVPAPAKTLTFPSATATANAAPAPASPAPAPAQPQLVFPAAQPAQDVAELPQAADVPTFPSATESPALVAKASPDQIPVQEQNLTFPAVEDAAPDVTVEASASEAPAPAAQAQIQIDENGQPYVLVKGQKFLLQAATPAAQ